MKSDLYSPMPVPPISVRHACQTVNQLLIFFKVVGNHSLALQHQMHQLYPHSVHPGSLPYGMKGRLLLYNPNVVQWYLGHEVSILLSQWNWYIPPSDCNNAGEPGWTSDWSESRKFTVDAIGLLQDLYDHSSVTDLNTVIEIHLRADTGHQIGPCIILCSIEAWLQSTGSSWYLRLSSLEVQPGSNPVWILCCCVSYVRCIYSHVINHSHLITVLRQCVSWVPHNR